MCFFSPNTRHGTPPQRDLVRNKAGGPSQVIESVALNQEQAMEQKTQNCSADTDEPNHRVDGPLGGSEVSQLIAMNRKRLLYKYGGCVDAKRAASLYSPAVEIDSDAIREAVRLRRVFAVDLDGELLFPVWQFGPGGGVCPGLAELLSQLGAYPHSSDGTQLAFLYNPHPMLDGLAPKDALLQGKVEAVAKAARWLEY
jgi:hypothetical protein